MPASITITAPNPGTTIPPNQVFSGTYTTSNAPFEHIQCIVTYPVSSGNNPLVVEMAANHVPNVGGGGGTWSAQFGGGLDPGLDANFTAEYFEGAAPGTRVDSDSIEDLDIVANPGGAPVGTISSAEVYRRSR